MFDGHPGPLVVSLPSIPMEELRCLDDGDAFSFEFLEVICITRSVKSIAIEEGHASPIVIAGLDQDKPARR